MFISFGRRAPFFVPSNLQVAQAFASSGRTLQQVPDPSEQSTRDQQVVLSQFVEQLQDASQSQQFRDRLSTAFSHLEPHERSLLIVSLLQKPTDLTASNADYVNQLFEAADTDGDKGRLTRVEFTHALQLHAAMETAAGRQAPNRRLLLMTGLAAAIPFVGFGFLDNFIMLVAGEEIDHAFGVKLGLSTLASAGLGNMVADVIGVSAANGIESSVRKLPLVRNNKLSKWQASLPSTKRAKALGASLGVMLGCLLGLAPLFINGTFFADRGV